MDVQTIINESDGVFNRLGCIKSIIYHTAAGPSVLSELDLPHKTKLTQRQNTN